MQPSWLRYKTATYSWGQFSQRAGSVGVITLASTGTSTREEDMTTAYPKYYSSFLVQQIHCPTHPCRLKMAVKHPYNGG
jgi:hypothetical protein